MADKWIDGFTGINQVCYDRESKEFVRISNGICTLDHSSPEAFRQSHGENGMSACIYAPSEAVAWRLVGVTKTKDPVVAYTYRGVKPENLEPAEDSSFVNRSEIRPSRFNGRV